MLKALPYLIAGLLAVGMIIQGANALYKHVRKSGVESCELAEKDKRIEALSKQAQFIIDEDRRRQKIEDIILSSPKTKIKSPVLMRTLVRLPNCAGKTQCPPS